MLPIEEDALLVGEREDLIEVLRMRFGEAPGDIIQHIYTIDQLDTLQRLILVAANAESWAVFMEEMQAGSEAFRIVGDRFNPLLQMTTKKGDLFIE